RCPARLAGRGATPPHRRVTARPAFVGRHRRHPRPGRRIRRLRVDADGSALVSELCDLAIASITTALVDGVRCVPRAGELTGRLAEQAATFVTLERDGRLLGCVGTLDAHQPLAIDVAEHALAAAFDDPRVPAVTIDD